MTTTPNLQIDHIAASQAQKEVTANTAFDALDKALSQFTEIALSDEDTALTDEQALGSMALSFTGTLTAGHTITIPAYAKLLLAENNTDGGFLLSLQTPSGTVRTLGNGQRKLFIVMGVILSRSPQPVMRCPMMWVAHITVRLRLMLFFYAFPCLALFVLKRGFQAANAWRKRFPRQPFLSPFKRTAQSSAQWIFRLVQAQQHSHAPVIPTLPLGMC